VIAVNVTLRIEAIIEQMRLFILHLVNKEIVRRGSARHVISRHNKLKLVAEPLVA